MVKVEFLMWFKIMEELAMTSCCGLGNGSSKSPRILTLDRTSNHFNRPLRVIGAWEVNNVNGNTRHSDGS